MKAQPLKERWLSALLLVGLVSQAAVAATHSALPVHPATQERPANDEEREGHDPTSCSFCRMAPAFVHGLVVSPLSLPIGADAMRHRVDAIPATLGQTLWARPASRAPPSPPNA
ncbi:MAG: hypothetical protein QNK03_21510 [Myxococcota bacterium]|nr:hypothetical protein [Myxococcota bacterium]